ncbi:HTH-type transcriptional activator Btr [compost metagenome]
MNSSNLVFHIHYCNGRKVGERARPLRRLARTLGHHELVLTTGGRGGFKLGGKTYPIAAGMLYYIAPGVPHVLEPDLTNRPTFMTVHFDYARVSFHEEEWEIAGGEPSLGLRPAGQLKDYYQVEDAFGKLIDCWNAKRPGYEAIARVLLQELWIAITRNLGQGRQQDAASLKVEKVIAYMNEKVEGRITLQELAELVQLAPTYLSRSFKEVTGYSVIAFFNKLKMDRAKDMLLTGDKKIKEVAQALGYSDEFYFSRIFKKTEGISPSEFYGNNAHGI